VKLPYVIDNQAHRLADILNGLLAEHKDLLSGADILYCRQTQRIALRAISIPLR